LVAQTLTWRQPAKGSTITRLLAVTMRAYSSS
jgi:hypothetical protein